MLVAMAGYSLEEEAEGSQMKIRFQHVVNETRPGNFRSELLLSDPISTRAAEGLVRASGCQSGERA